MKKIAIISALSDPYFELMRAGRKSWEIRLKAKEWAKIKPKDALLLFHRGGKGEFLVVEVLERREYTSIREALEDIGFQNAIPQAKSIEEALAEYRRFYSKEKERRYGVMALRVVPILIYEGEITCSLIRKYVFEAGD